MSTNSKNSVIKWIMDILRLFHTSNSLSQMESPSPAAMTIAVKKDETTALNKFYEHLELREGRRNKVYLDSLGKPTVGVGHLVLPEDKLKVGDVISDERIRDFLEDDASKAWAAAKRQAVELGKAGNWNFVIALGSVNFQLGTNWTSKFHATYAYLLRNMPKQAISNIKVSLWAKQTPVRTADFIAAIEVAFKV